MELLPWNKRGLTALGIIFVEYISDLLTTKSSSVALLIQKVFCHAARNKSP